MYSLLRYHINIYVPKWGKDSLLVFLEELKDKKLSLSKHANKKLRRMKDANISNFVNDFKISTDILDKIFEFYSHEERIKKVCIRVPFIVDETDMVLVISDVGTIVTIYILNKDDSHETLNRTPYVVE